MRSRLLRGGVFVVAGLVVMSLSGCFGSDPTATPVTAITATPFPTAVLLPPTAAPSATATVSPTEVPAPPTATAFATATVVPTVEPSPVVVPTDTVTATVVSEPTATAIPSSTQTATPTASATTEPTEVPTFVPTPSPTVTATATATPTATPTPVPTATYTPSPTSTPDPVAAIGFVDNKDCESISRDLLATMVVTISNDSASFEVVAEVADSSGERQQGLMCREVVPAGTGMLFVFEAAQSLSFWMFNTYVPLDIVYLDDQRRAVRGVRMEPCPRPEGYENSEWRSQCSGASPAYGSGGAALYALELPAGWLAGLGLELENLEGVEFSW